MGKISKFSISFNENGIFKPGSEVTGSVQLDVSGSVKFYSIKAVMEGKCQIRWKNKTGHTRKTYKADETYCRQELLLWGIDSTAGYHSLTGSMEKDFLFELPLTSPSSFQSAMGSVVYKVTVTCKTTGLFQSRQHAIEQSFTVFDPIDLSQNPDVHQFCQPLELRGEHEQTSCCVRRSCTFDLTTEKRAYVPGERLVINGQISNDSSKRLPFFITLKRHCTFRGRRSHLMGGRNGRPLKETRRTEAMCVWQADAVLPRMRYVAVNMPSMRIPEGVSASGLRHCRLINISYTIEVTGKLKGLCGSKQFSLGEFPVVIGSRIDDDAGENTAQLPSTSPPTSSDLPPAFHEIEPTAPPATDFVDEVGHYEGGGITAPWHNDEPPPSYDDVIGTNHA